MENNATRIQMRSRRSENGENVEFWWKGRAIAMRHAGAISDNNYTSSGKVSVYEHTSMYAYI